MTTVDDVKQAARNADRVGHQITSGMLTNRTAANVWLREIMILQARIRSYARAWRGAVMTSIDRDALARKHHRLAVQLALGRRLEACGKALAPTPPLPMRRPR